MAFFSTSFYSPREGVGSEPSSRVLEKSMYIMQKRLSQISLCSFFELYAQERLMPGLYEALRFCAQRMVDFYTIENANEIINTVESEPEPEEVTNIFGHSHTAEYAYALLKKGYRKLIRYMHTHRLNQTLSTFILKNFDTLYFLIITLIEVQSLYGEKGSFAEAFYGIERIDSRLFEVYTKRLEDKDTSELPLDAAKRKIKDLENNKKLAHELYKSDYSPTHKQVLTSIMLQVVWPLVRRYMEKKFRDTRYQIAHENEDSNSESHDVSLVENNDPIHNQPFTAERLYTLYKKLIRIFVNYMKKIYKKTSNKYFMISLFPFIISFWDIVCFMYKALYIMDNTSYPYFHPMMHMIGMVYTRRPSAPGTVLANDKFKYSNFQCVAKMFRSALIGAVVVFRAIEWWVQYENTFLPPPKLKNTSIPPPPDIPIQIHPNAKPLPQDPLLCPLCYKNRESASSIPSGYVFCYKCIFDFISHHKQCPITQLPTDVNQIRRLYEMRL